MTDPVPATPIQEYQAEAYVATTVDNLLYAIVDSDVSAALSALQYEIGLDNIVSSGRLKQELVDTKIAARLIYDDEGSLAEQTTNITAAGIAKIERRTVQF